MNGNDGDQPYDLGVRFSTDTSVPCVGIQWRYVPTSISGSPPPGGSHLAALWRVSDQARLAFQDFIPVAASENQNVLFDAPITLDPAELYLATIFTRDYVFRASGGVDVVSPSGTLTGDQGRLVADADPTVFPANVVSSYFYVSPLIDLGGEPAEGTVALGLDLAVAATGGADAEGSAALGLDLAVAASGTARAQGAVALTLGLAPAAAGERASQGAAAVDLGLAVAAAGERSSRGSAALGINIAVAATGSNGEAGCPVSPWPWTPRVLSGYPETARPVKSFPGGDC
jgi:hypothetical protein